MKILLVLLFLFLAGCMLGWVIEVLFRRIFSAKKWVNPGFMKGPWLPLYGFGVLVMFLLCYFVVAFFPSSWTFYNPLGNLFGRDYVSGPTIYDLLPIFLMWIGMVLLEFIAGLIFVKGFHVKLWDYSNIKGNIMGIICPLFNVIWLGVAILFYYGVNPFLDVLANNVYTYMFGENGSGAHFGFIFVIGILYGFLIYDLVTSLGLFASISKFARQSGILDRYEDIKERYASSASALKRKLFSNIPAKPESESIENPLKQKIESMIYIDPELEHNKPNNYDESGRPIKENEPQD